MMASIYKFSDCSSSTAAPVNKIEPHSYLLYKNSASSIELHKGIIPMVEKSTRMELVGF